MYKEKACGCIRAFRHEGVDLEVDLAQKDPITMRTYLGLAAECLDKKKDLVLGIAITEEHDVRLGDYLPRELVQRGVLYLAESINLYKFSVSRMNPNVISVGNRDVRDPVKQKPIHRVYYYTVPNKDLQKSLAPVSVHVGACAEGKLADLGSDMLAELFQMFPVVITAEYVGNEQDFAENSIFHEYLQSNLIIQDVPNDKEAIEKITRTERVILGLFLVVFILLIILSFTFYTAKHQMSTTLLVSHIIILFLGCVTLVANRVI
ncbi:hypothetical protein NECID01_1721 [Nematocida sp. AWRm77]|nr:hypothetical protein NECID01_1721 [Nematocida sp. AWRm77]